MSEQNIATVKKVDAAFANNNIEDFFNECVENVEWTMAGEQPVKGLSAIREWMKQMEGCEPPAINNHKMIADNGSVAAYGDMSMKNKDGEAEVFDYCDLYDFNEDGKITKLISFVIKKKPHDAENIAAA